MNAWISTLPADKVERWIAANGERAMEQHDTDDAYFALWLHYLNRAVMRRVLIGYRDLEDWDYWSAYDGDMNPVEAAELMLDCTEEYCTHERTTDEHDDD